MLRRSVKPGQLHPTTRQQGRQQNRRVEVVVSGESIGVAVPSDPPQ